MAWGMRFLLTIFLLPNTFLDIPKDKKASFLHWEAAWFEVYSASDKNVALIVLSLSFVAVLVFHVVFVSMFLSKSMIL